MIKLLTRYLVVRLSVMSGYALLALSALYSFFDLLAEVGNIGQGSYTSLTAFQYVAMQLPAHAYQLMPLAVLIGGLTALNRLSANSELAVIKTSGLSTVGMIRMVLSFSLMFAVLTAILGEWAAPELSRRADTLKASAKSGQISSVDNGLWIKQQDSMIYIDAMLPDQTLTGIKIWRYGSDFKLIEALSAEKATVEQENWLLHNIHSSVFEPDRIRVSEQVSRHWSSSIGSSLLGILRVRPEQMSFSALGGYIRHLENNHQQTLPYRVEWWNKLVYPIATMIMSLVALAFTPLSGRHTNMGLKLFGGICLGLLFHFSGRLFAFTSILYGVPAFLAAVLPTTVFAVWAVYLIWRQEKR